MAAKDYKTYVPVIDPDRPCFYCTKHRLTAIVLTDGTRFYACLACNRLNFPLQSKKG